VDAQSLQEKPGGPRRSGERWRWTSRSVRGRSPKRCEPTPTTVQPQAARNLKIRNNDNADVEWKKVDSEQQELEPE
jgi:hypothetical protein